MMSADVLDADGQADQAVRDADLRPLLRWHRPVRGYGRIEHETVDVSERRRRHDQLQCLEEAEHVVAAGIAHLERDHPATLVSIEHRRCSAEILESGVVHPCHARVVRQPGRDGRRVVTLLFHPEGERLEPAQRQPRLEWSGDRSDQLVDLAQRGGALGRGGNHAAGDIAMPAEILGGRMDDRIDAERRGIDQPGCRECVVDRDPGVVPVRQRGDLSQVRDSQEGIRNRFRVDERRARRVQRLLERIEIEEVDEHRLDAKAGEQPVEDGIGGAVDVGRGDDPLSGADVEEHRRVDRSHPRCKRDRVFRPFQGCDRGLQGARGRVGIARVYVSLALVAEYRVERVGIVIDKRGGRIDRGGCWSKVGTRPALSGMDGAAGEPQVSDLGLSRARLGRCQNGAPDVNDGNSYRQGV